MLHDETVSVQSLCENVADMHNFKDCQFFLNLHKAVDIHMLILPKSLDFYLQRPNP